MAAALSSNTIFIRLCILISVLVVPGAVAESSDDFEPHSVIGAFLGATDPEEYSTEFTYGLEYGYRITPEFGVGAVYEKTDDGHDGAGTSVALGSLYYSPVPGWRLGGGVGSEKVDGHHGKSSHSETLYRLGVAYHFYVGGFGLSPVVNFDFVDGDRAIVYGVAISRALGGH